MYKPRYNDIAVTSWYYGVKATEDMNAADKIQTYTSTANKKVCLRNTLALSDLNIAALL